MSNYLKTQNELIAKAQELFGDEKNRVDAVTFDGKEFITFINTHASSYPQITHYSCRGSKGFNALEAIVNDWEYDGQ